MAMTPKQLLTVIESALLGPLPPSPSQRVELMHALRSSVSALQCLHSYPAPKPSDRAQVQSKEVRLPNGPVILLDDQDVQIITFSLLFSLVIAFVSDALSAAPDKTFVLSRDASFRHEFHEIVRQKYWWFFFFSVLMNFLMWIWKGTIRLAWAVHLMLIQDALTGRDVISSAASSSDLGYL